jgi:hypothetical protein
MIEADPDLYGMLDAQGLGDKVRDACHLYARMVIGHENDTDCGKILQELKGAGFRVASSGTCRLNGTLHA